MRFWRGVTTVLWAFFGIRRGEAHREAAKQIKPLQIIVTAICLVLVFIIGLVILVNSITAHAV